MSSKVNILGIISNHWSTLTDARTNKYSKADILCFTGIPFLISLLSLYFSVVVNSNTNSIFVNFGSIFTALLLSVLVLVYDQKSKINEDEFASNPLLKLKSELLTQLFYNICYAILISIIMVVICLLSEIVGDSKWLVIKYFGYKGLVINDFEINWKESFFTPAILFLLTHLVLTVLMVLKRLQSLLN